MVNIHKLDPQFTEDVPGGRVGVMKHVESGLYFGFLFAPHPNPSGQVQWKVVSRTKIGMDSPYRALDLAKKLVMT